MLKNSSFISLTRPRNGKEWEYIVNYNHLNFRSGSQCLLFSPVICCFVTRIHCGFARVCCQVRLRCVFLEMVPRPSFRWGLRSWSCWIALVRAWKSIRLFVSCRWDEFLLACGGVLETLRIAQPFLILSNYNNKQQCKWGFHQANCGQNIANIIEEVGPGKGRSFTD